MTVKDVFKKPAVKLDLGSVVSLTYQFEHAFSDPKWYVVEKGDTSLHRSRVYPVVNKKLFLSTLELTVDRQFKFGTYIVVVDDTHEHSVTIPHRLGEKIPITYT